MFELQEAALNAVAQGVDVAVDHGLDLAVAPGRDDRDDLSGGQVVADGRMRSGADDCLGSWKRAHLERHSCLRIGRMGHPMRIHLQNPAN